MAAIVFNNFTKPGGIFGLRIHQIIVIGVTSVPVWATAAAGRWAALMLATVSWGIAIALIVVPIGGRSAVGWLAAMLSFGFGTAAGWTQFTSRLTRGKATSALDLPGPLANLEVIDGPPTGGEQTRQAIIRNRAQGRWAITARIAHPGIGMDGTAARNVLASAFRDMLDQAAQSDLIEECQLMVRMSPASGAERERYLRQHLVTNSPDISKATNIELLDDSRDDVTPEAFGTFCVTDTQLKRLAGTRSRESQMAALTDLAREVTGWLIGLGCSSVHWLTSPELAAVIRTGFAPADTPAAPPTSDVSWETAGPSRAQPALRAYHHDRWATITATTRVPDKGAVIGSIAPILVPCTAGERRCLVVVFRLIPKARAERKASTAELVSGTLMEVKASLRVKIDAKERVEHGKTSQAEYQLATGGSLIDSYVVAAVTAPADANLDEVGRRFDSSIRSAGFHPQRLDVAHDLGFVAACLPVGISLGRS